MKLLDCKDIQRITGRGETWCYSLIRKLNKELKDKGYLVIRGKVPEKYFKERFYN